MQYPLIQADLTRSQTVSRFYGLNRREKGRNGEFYEMLGLSSDRYPCMASAKRETFVCDAPNGVQAAISPKFDIEIENFTGVANGKFYYNGNRKQFETKDMSIPADAQVTLVDFNSRIIICAYDGTDSIMYYYGYTASDDDKVHKMERTASGTFEVHTDGDPNKDAIVINYLTGLTLEQLDLFSVGDAVTLTGFGKAANNTQVIDSKYETADRTRFISAIVEKIERVDDTENRLYLQLYNYLHERLVFTPNDSGTTVKISIPTMNHICIHNNRLWGTNPNGEYIYASKLADPFNWNTYQGLANDSYYAEIGTAGEFVGIVSYRDNLVAFKRNYIHHVYGDKPSNYSIPKQLSDCGCIDIRSAVQIGMALYFLGYNGFYQYQGGQPELISENLDMTYKYAAAGTDGQKYVVSCTDTNGTKDIFVFDTRYNTWHREHAIDAINMFRHGTDLFIATVNAIYKYGSGKPETWNAKTIIINDAIFENKGAIELWIRAKLGRGAYINIRTAEDGGAWVGSFKIDREGLHRYKIPVRFINGDYYAIKFDGYGEAVILDIERKVVYGGRDFRG